MIEIEVEVFQQNEVTMAAFRPTKFDLLKNDDFKVIPSQKGDSKSTSLPPILGRSLREVADARRWSSF